MATQNSTPAGATGATPAAELAPAVESEIERAVLDTLTQVTAWCQGPIGLDNTAKTLAMAIVDVFKRHIESKRKRLEEVMELIVEDVYMSGNMALNTKQYVERIVEVLLEGL